MNALDNLGASFASFSRDLSLRLHHTHTQRTGTEPSLRKTGTSAQTHAATSTRCASPPTCRSSSRARRATSGRCSPSSARRQSASTAPVRSSVPLSGIGRCRRLTPQVAHPLSPLSLSRAGKPVPKTFAVCTIRSTPSTAHHCIAWAKSYLFPCVAPPFFSSSFSRACRCGVRAERIDAPRDGNSQLFGADDEADQQELDDAEKNGENGALPPPSSSVPVSRVYPCQRLTGGGGRSSDAQTQSTRSRTCVRKQRRCASCARRSTRRGPRDACSTRCVACVWRDVLPAFGVVVPHPCRERN